MTFFLETLRLGLTNLLLHKLRSLLTALGIIFGVAAVITMVSIGEGNKQKALADIRQLGVTNVILRSVEPAQSESMAGGRSRLVKYGITRHDQRRILETVHPMDAAVPLKQVGSQVYRGVRQVPSAGVFGTTPDLADLRSRLEGVGQEHLLTFADDLADDQRAALLAQIAGLDLERLPEYVETYVKNSPDFAVQGELAPAPLYAADHSIAGGGTWDEEGARAAGEALIRDGKVACLICGQRVDKARLKQHAQSTHLNAFRLRHFYRVPLRRDRGSLSK